MDLSNVVLQLTATQSTSIAAFQNPHNEAFLVDFDSPLSSPVTREGTPSLQAQSLSAVLRLTDYPFSPELGWVFGSDDEECDFLLGPQNQGVSRKHFRVDFNWTTLTLVLTNMSGLGFQWSDSQSGDGERVLTSRAVLGWCRVSAGLVDLTLHVPSRNEEQQAKFETALNKLREERDGAMPRLDGMRIKSTSLATPQVVGVKRKFILRNVIGTGGFAIVHKAIDHETGDAFAAKEYSFVEDGDRALIPMMNELGILQTLRHRHIIEYVAVFKDPFPIIIMELAIKSLLSCKFKLVSECVVLLKHVLAGLEYLHGKNIIHRDVKPGNVLLTKENPPEWKLSDFGLSKVAKTTTTFCGSPLYLAPELCKRKTYTAAIDVWALGIIGVQYATGPNSKLWRMDTRDERWPDAVRQQALKSPLAVYVTKMLEAEPAKRSNAGAVLRHLEGWSEGQNEEFEPAGHSSTATARQERAAQNTEEETTLQLPESEATPEPRTSSDQTGRIRLGLRNWTL